MSQRRETGVSAEKEDRAAGLFDHQDNRSDMKAGNLFH
jgi:hypothetical protein